MPLNILYYIYTDLLWIPFGASGMGSEWVHLGQLWSAPCGSVASVTQNTVSNIGIFQVDLVKCKLEKIYDLNLMCLLKWSSLYQ